MKKLKKGEKGFTLIELLIAIAITGIIAGAITGAIFQVFNVNTRTSNRMIAVRQVQHAGFWVSPDVQMALEVDTESEFLKLTWTEWAAGNTTGNSHTIIYSLVDMPSGEFKILQRSHSVNGGNPTLTHVAEYIDPAETSCVCNCEDCDCNDLVLTFMVTATVGEESETRVYEAKPRPGS